MYYYILDLGNKEIVKIKEKMEMILARYGIPGDLGKISPLSSAYDLAKRAVEKGYTTICPVGGDEIINQVASALVKTSSVMGIIPLSVSESISTLIGTNSWLTALEILRLRKIENIDVGKISETKYFITEAKLESKEKTKTFLDFGDFKIEGEFSSLSISNGIEERKRFSDQVFDIIILNKPKPVSFFKRVFKKEFPYSSIFHSSSVLVETEEQSTLQINNEVVAKTPCKIILLPAALRLIVARESSG